MELFKFEGRDISTLQKEGIVLFDPKEVGACLEISERTVEDKLLNLEIEIEKVHLTRTLIESLSEDTDSTRTLGNFGKTYLTEAGVYQFVMESRSQKAKDFKKWLCREVLPALRKTGTYSIPTINPPVMTKERQVVEAFKAYKEIGEMMQLPSNVIVSESAKMIDRDYGTTMVGYIKSSPLLDHVDSKDEFLEPSELGKRFDLSGIAMNKRLEALGLQSKKNGEWVPTGEDSKLCFVHQWVTGSKTGYNLKWNFQEISKRIPK